MPVTSGRVWLGSLLLLCRDLCCSDFSLCVLWQRQTSQLASCRMLWGAPTVGRRARSHTQQAKQAGPSEFRNGAMRVQTRRKGREGPGAKCTKRPAGKQLAKQCRRDEVRGPKRCCVRGGLCPRARQYRPNSSVRAVCAGVVSVVVAKTGCGGERSTSKPYGPPPPPPENSCVPGATRQVRADGGRKHGAGGVARAAAQSRPVNMRTCPSPRPKHGEQLVVHDAEAPASGKSPSTKRNLASTPRRPRTERCLAHAPTRPEASPLARSARVTRRIQCAHVRAIRLCQAHPSPQWPSPYAGDRLCWRCWR